MTLSIYSEVRTFLVSFPPLAFDLLFCPLFLPVLLLFLESEEESEESDSESELSDYDEDDSTSSDELSLLFR